MQDRVLVRTDGPSSFRRALVERLTAGSLADIRSRVVIVPTRAAAELLRQSCEHTLGPSGVRARVLPDLVTRDEWLRRLHASVPSAPLWLERTEREILFSRAVRTTLARKRGARPSFAMRPGLIATMVDFYDALKLRQRTVRRFARVLFDELRVEGGTDTGSENLIAQTRFLGYAFLAYERLVATSGGLDEHVLRRQLLTHQPELTIKELLVAVADHPSDPRGLWPADFDLIGRLRAIQRVEVFVTDEVHDAGFRDRLEMELPGLVERRATQEAARPVIVAASDVDGPVAVSRDREEELRDVARVIRARAEADGGVLRAGVAVVYRRPLPYLYLAHHVFTDARIDYQAFDAQPLAVEPYAALVDLLLDVIRTRGGRASALAALRSSLLAFEVDGSSISRRDVLELERVLAGSRSARGVADFERIVRAQTVSTNGRRAPALRAAVAAATFVADLEPFRSGASASIQVDALARVIRKYERFTHRGADNERSSRARAAVLATLDALANGYQAYDDEPRPPDELTATIHHALEARTFTPRRGTTGVHLVDRVAARFGEFDHTHIVGLVETDWSERSTGNIFYAASLLKSLGWPQDADQDRAELAGFRDLLNVAARSTRLSRFELDGDAIVGPSPLVEVLKGATVAVGAPDERKPVFTDELIAAGLRPLELERGAAEWLALRHARPRPTARAYTGFVDPRAPEPYRVSRVDRYINCPFKYFAESVLRLDEERDELSGLSPLERGTLLHSIFERFYTAWQAQGGRAITAALIGEAADLFERIVRESLAELEPGDRALEETRLLGSLVSRGVGERVFELEADSRVAVHDRWLERDLRGTFSFPLLGGLDTRSIEIRGKVDRLDLLADGSLRVIDYKLGRMPDLDSSTQIAVYAHCARQLLEAADGGTHPVSAAMYFAFGEERRLEGRMGGANDTSAAVGVRAGDFAAAVSRIEAGEFPPQPQRPSECQFCGYSGVCRKEYLVSDDEES